jgi:hypothetical protein
MVDERTGSVWSHLDGSAVGGEFRGRQLEIRPLQTTTWSAWVEQYPQTTVPVAESGYVYRQVRLGGSGLGYTFQQSLQEIDQRLAENELVIGVLAGDEARAFPIRRVPDDAPMQDAVAGVPVVILEGSDGIPSLAYHRALTDGRVLDFERRDGAIYDTQTGSRWNASGLAVEGELAGVQLAYVTSFFTEWYGWAAFHPHSAIYGASEA